MTQKNQWPRNDQDELSMKLSQEERSDYISTEYSDFVEGFQSNELYLQDGDHQYGQFSVEQMSQVNELKSQTKNIEILVVNELIDATFRTFPNQQSQEIAKWKEYLAPKCYSFSTYSLIQSAMKNPTISFDQQRLPNKKTTKSKSSTVTHHVLKNFIESFKSSLQRDPFIGKIKHLYNEKQKWGNPQKPSKIHDDYSTNDSHEKQGSFEEYLQSTKKLINQLINPTQDNENRQNLQSSQISMMNIDRKSKSYNLEVLTKLTFNSQKKQYYSVTRRAMTLFLRSFYIPKIMNSQRMKNKIRNIISILRWKQKLANPNGSNEIYIPTEDEIRSRKEQKLKHVRDRDIQKNKGNKKRKIQ